MGNNTIQQVCLLGATGSIGDSTLSVLAAHPDRFQLHTVAAHRNIEKMLEICQRFLPQYAVMTDPICATHLKQALAHQKTIVLTEHSDLETLVQDQQVDIVVGAIMGASGLRSTFAAIQADKKVLLANKESLVIAGHLLMPLLKKSKAQLLPLDSEHNAIFQCLPKNIHGEVYLQGVKSLILTASGGPFRETPLEALATVTIEQALNHPRWKMGQKISIDSATLMNKGLEFIEAHYLFDISPQHIQVVIHPQSIIHSLVEYNDGSLLAQLGSTDMRIPIAYALSYPERIASGAKRLNMTEIVQLNFMAPDEIRFPCLRLAKQALLHSPAALVAMNAANEVAVEAFIGKKIGFMQISQWVEAALNNVDANEDVNSIQAILDYDARVRQQMISTLHK